MLMYCKLLRKKSIFAINYNYLFPKHDLFKRDGTVMLSIFLEKYNLSTCLYVSIRLLLIPCLNCVI